MKPNDLNPSTETPAEHEATEEIETSELPRPQPPEPQESEVEGDASEAVEVSSVAEEPDKAEGVPTIDRKKALILGGGLAVAVLFFLLTMMMGHSSQKKASTGKPTVAPPAAQATMKSSGSVAPVMDAIRKVDPNPNDGQLTAEDIRRMRPVGSPPLDANNPPRAASTASAAHTSSGNLASVPSFADTQQKWEDPRPYDQGDKRDRPQPQELAAVRETSLVFVRASTQANAVTKTPQGSEVEEPLLDITPGSRIMAKLQYAISTADAAPVVAQVEYTYAIGEQIVVPAGTLIYGHIEQADRVGYVSVKFDEVEIDHKRQRIDAIGQSLNMGPIKGKVTGTNTGKTLLVRTVSGIGATMAMVFGNSTSSAFSEDDLIRERLAENAGTAGDSAIMNLALTSKEVVTVDADTKIYVVFTKHEKTSSGLYRANPAPM